MSAERFDALRPDQRSVLIDGLSGQRANAPVVSPSRSTGGDTPYSGKTAVLATLHGKEAVIAPAFKQHLQLVVDTAHNVDTNLLGTFTGEVSRRGSMLETAIRKARMGMQASGCKIGLASEGSFGPHEALHFFAADTEVMVLVDDERSLVISERLVDLETNFRHAVTDRIEALDGFLDEVDFPNHALVVQPNSMNGPWWKLHPDLGNAAVGVVDRGILSNAIKRCAARSDDRLARITTDMRAHVNPTRMKVIARVAERLAQRAANLCPSCSMPGFGTVRPAPGVTCQVCGEETIVPRGTVLGCVACDYQSEELHPDIGAGEPADCAHCNP